jgi:hypothetical protein
MSRGTLSIAGLVIAGMACVTPVMDYAEQAPSAPSKPSAQATPPQNGLHFEMNPPAIVSGPWNGKRLVDGQPDISGDWSNTAGNHNNFTDPQGGVPNDPQDRGRPLKPRSSRAQSRVSDPSDGELPYLPWARAKQLELQAGFFNNTRPEYVEPLARCAPAGIPKSFYWHGYEIRQYPGAVLFLFGSGSRIVHLDQPDHLPSVVSLWQGDSRGHWEGNTLVVDVSNLNSKARLGRTGDFTTENVHVVERYIFDSGNRRYDYVATFTDPTAFSRPFTVTIPARRWTVENAPNDWHYEVPLANTVGKDLIGDHLERICVENNGGFGQVAVQSKK